LRKKLSLNGTTPCGTPTTPTVEPGRAMAKAVAIDCPVPTHSSAASTPTPPRELEDCVDGRLAASFDDVGGAELQAGDAHERAAGERDADRLSLAAVDLAVAERTAGDAGDGRPVLAVRAGAVAVDERSDHEIALGDAVHVGADVLDDADQLVADGPGGVGRLAAVVPEVRAAHAGEYDPNHGVGPFLDDRVGPLADLDGAGPLEDRSSHGYDTTTSRPIEGDRVDRGTNRISLLSGAARTVDEVNTRNDIREFLVSRGGKITPEQAGLSVYGANRRVSGLRREEVAMLAGISVEYYTRLERGDANGASEDVLEGIARALQLDEAERAHPFDLVRAASTTRPPRGGPSQERVRPTVQRILDAMRDVPAYVYTAEPGTPSHEALNLLASWSPTPTAIPAGDAADER
jgi:transcriptional regulator with XRE-family HTH domain